MNARTPVRATTDAEAGPDGDANDAARRPSRFTEAITKGRAVAGSTRTQVEAYRDRLEAARATNRTVDVALSTYEHDSRQAGGLIAGALAYRFFFWTLPFTLVVVAVLGLASSTSGSSEEVARNLGVFGFASKSISEAGSDATTTWWLAALVGIPALYLASISFVKALWAAHALVWRIPISPPAARFRQALEMNGALLVLGLATLLEHEARLRTSLGGLVLTLAFPLLVAAVWVAVSWRLPHRAPTWHELVPGALVVAAGTQLVHLVTVYYVARKLQRASSTYGSLGTAACILLALYFIARVVVAGAALNAHLDERRRRAHRGERPALSSF